MSDYFCDSFTTDQLLMCEKEELVKYIEELKKENDEVFEQASKVRDESIKFDNELEKLKESYKNLLEELSEMEDKCVHQDDVYDYVECDGKVILDKDDYEEMEKEIKKLQLKPVTRSDTRIKQLEEQVDKLQIQSHLCDISVIIPMKNHVTKLNDECSKLKEKVEELESQIELTNECVIDGLKQGHKDLQEEIDRLQEENKKLQDDKDKAWQEGYDEGELEHSVDKEYLDEKDDEIKKLKEELEWKKIDIQKEVKRFEYLKKENEKLKEELEKPIEKLADEIVKADGCKGAYSHPLDLVESWVNEKIDEIDEIEELKKEVEKLKKENEEHTYTLECKEHAIIVNHNTLWKMTSEIRQLNDQLDLFKTTFSPFDNYDELDKYIQHLKKKNETWSKRCLEAEALTDEKLEKQNKELKEENKKFKNCLAEIWQSAGLGEEE